VRRREKYGQRRYEGRHRGIPKCRQSNRSGGTETRFPTPKGQTISAGYLDVVENATDARRLPFKPFNILIRSMNHSVDVDSPETAASILRGNMSMENGRGIHSSVPM